MLQLNQIHYEINGKAVLRGLNWQLAAGEHGLLLGASGCGKTTLLHIIAGLLAPTSGTLVAPRGAGQVSLIFQTLHLVDALSVADNLRMAQWVARQAADEAHIQLLLSSLGLADKMRVFPRELSHGQAQRVAIARALAVRPALILADEPTSALDDAHAEATIRLLRDQADEYGATLLVATHDQRIKPYFARELAL